jgi:aminopeptidase N
MKAVQLLNSDVYEPVSNALIEPGVKSLEYIQQTSDIFFPTNWLQAMLGSHKSKEARLIVEKFIISNPNFPEHLRNKIFEAAWTIMKQQTYVTKAQPVIVSKKTTTPVKEAPAKKAPAKKASSKKASAKKAPAKKK